jgi:hypothetical protein
MALDLASTKRFIQDHLQEGLLLVVGSGLSAAEGIPGMNQVANHLKTAMPKRLAAAPDPRWDLVTKALDAGDHLEAAMQKVDLLTSTVDFIVAETAVLIRTYEELVFQKVLDKTRELPFSTFVKHLFKAGKKFHLITPNYDRLIELATETAGIGIDNRFVGQFHGRSDAKMSADAHRESYVSGKVSGFRVLPHLCIYKPHGSLDWFSVGGQAVRCSVQPNRPPVIITPGVSKYRQSFDAAFDDQRTAGNRAVENATRFLFLGYGFNDDHLEQYICPGLIFKKPALIVARTLSDNALKAVNNSNGTMVVALGAVSSTDSRTRIISSDGDDFIVDEELWHLEGLNKGVI